MLRISDLRIVKVPSRSDEPLARPDVLKSITAAMSVNSFQFDHFTDILIVNTANQAFLASTKAPFRSILFLQLPTLQTFLPRSLPNAALQSYTALGVNQ